MVKRTILFVVLCTVIWIGSTFYYSAAQPEISTQLTVAAVNGGNTEAANLRVAQQVNNQVAIVTLGLSSVAFIVCYGTYIKRGIGQLVKAKENSNA
jgi:hypothetical protein